MKRKKVTMKDIAGKLNLSVNAVSLALNDRDGVSDETRKLVLNTAEKMGYLEQSVRYMQTFAGKNICVLLKDRYFRDFRFYGRILLGIEEKAKQSGYDVFINSFVKEEVPACITGRKVSGVIVVGKIEDSFLNRIKQYKLPVVLVDYISLEESTDSVISDSRTGAYKMTAYLLEKGKKKIGYFGDTQYTPSTRDRFLGFLDAMQQHLGFKTFKESMNYVDRFSILENVEDYVISQDSAGIYEAFMSIPEKPEVLVCSNDELAIFLMRTLQEKGYTVPTDIGIVGFDDIELSRMVTPALTTVHVQKKLMGEKAMQRLLHRMAHKSDDVEKVVLEVEVVERNSV